MQGYAIFDVGHLAQSLAEFQYCYNVTRAHQHLRGRTPMEAWQGTDARTRVVKAVEKFEAWGGKLTGMVLRH